MKNINNTPENTPNTKNNKPMTDGRMRYELRRKKLSELSTEARRLRADKVCELMQQGKAREAELWAFKRVNDIIADGYREQTGCEIFKTFNQWKNEGMSIKKDSTSFILWGRKRTANAIEQKDEQAAQVLSFEIDGEEPSESEYQFFPLVYLFSDLQVELNKERPTSKEQAEPTVKKKSSRQTKESKVVVLD